MRVFTRIILAAIILCMVCGPLAAQSSQQRFVFVANGQTSGEGIFSVFTGDPTTRALTAVPGSPFQAGSDAIGVVADPTGRFVYVLDNVTQNVWAYSINASTGVPTLLPGAPFATGLTLSSSIAIDPTDRFLYVGGTYFNDVKNFTYDAMAAFSLDPNLGVPTAISGSPVIFNQTVDTSLLTIDQSGTFIYAPGHVTSYSINFETGIPALVGYNVNNPSGLPALDPLGGFASVGSLVVAIDPINGYASPLGIAQPAQSGGESVFAPSGAFFYAITCSVLNSNCGTDVSSLQVNQQTGLTTSISGVSVGSAAYLTSIVEDPTGDFIYAVGGSVYGFSVNQSTGTLTPVAGSPWSMSYANGAAAIAIALAPSGVTNPAPSITSLSPASGTTATESFTLTVNGSNFVPGSRVYFGGRGRVTTYVSATQLSANILAADIATGGTAVVFVYNPPVGGGASPSVEFPVLNPTPVISSINPTSVTAGGPALNLVVNGSSFLPNSVVTLNGTAQTTTYVGPTELQIFISSAVIAAPGTDSIAVTTPSIGGAGGGNFGIAFFCDQPYGSSASG